MYKMSVIGQFFHIIMSRFYLFPFLSMPILVLRYYDFFYNQ